VLDASRVHHMLSKRNLIEEAQLGSKELCSWAVVLKWYAYATGFKSARLLQTKPPPVFI